MDTEIDIQDVDFTLQSLIDMKVNDMKDEIAEIALKANKEAELEKQLKIVIDSWDGIEFILNTFKDSKDVFILGQVEDIVTLLEDSMVAITNIITNRFVGPLWEEVEPW
jgi:dynein heavy chain